MKKLISILIISIFASIAGYAQKQQQQTIEYVKIGDACPNFTICDSDGKNVNLTDFKGKVVLINFFATWCGPCQKELAEVESNLYPKYKDNKDFVLLVIGREHSTEELQKYNLRKNFSFPLYSDKSRAAFSKFANQTIPRSYLVGKNGKIIVAHTGYGSQVIQDFINKIDKELSK